MTNRIGKTPRRVRIRKKRLDGVQTRRELRLAGCWAFGVSYLIVSGCLCAHYISASHLLPPELKFVRKLSQTPGVTGEDHLPGERVTHMVINPTATTKEERKKTKIIIWKWGSLVCLVLIVFVFWLSLVVFFFFFYSSTSRSIFQVLKLHFHRPLVRGRHSFSPFRFTRLFIENSIRKKET